jgi:hypothetical protein
MGMSSFRITLEEFSASQIEEVWDEIKPQVELTPVEHIVSDVSGSDTSVVVASGTSVDGSIDIGINQGIIYKVGVEVVSGTCDDADVLLGDSSFSGSPNILYQIGRTSLDEPIWVPDDGDWVDRNPLGFDGLTGGLLYYRLTNNSATSVTFNVLVRAQGSII